MSAACGYYSPFYFDSLDPSESVKLSPVIRDSFFPRERPCGSCRRPFTTTPRLYYFCRPCWHDVRREDRQWC